MDWRKTPEFKALVKEFENGLHRIAKDHDLPHFTSLVHLHDRDGKFVFLHEGCDCWGCMNTMAEVISEKCFAVASSPARQVQH